MPTINQSKALPGNKNQKTICDPYAKGSTKQRQQPTPNKKRDNNFLASKKKKQIATSTIPPHMSFAVMRLPSDSPKDGRTVTLTF